MNDRELRFETGYDPVWLTKAFTLFNEAGLKRDDVARVGQAFENSTRVVTCWSQGRLIGVGRMLSDLALYASIFDVAVHPDFQKRGIGKTIMLQLLENVPETCVHLTSTFGNESFYRSLGFRPHKTAMALYPERLKNSPYLEKSS